MDEMKLTPKLKLIRSSVSKSALCLNNIKDSDEEHKNLPFDELMTSLTDEEKQEIIKLEDPKEIIFIGSKNIHDILYDMDKCINICYKKLEKDFSNYFYLALLIEINSELINYKYSFKVIEDLVNLSLESKGEFYEIIISKIIDILIKNYDLSDVKDDENIDLKKKEEINEKNEKRKEEALSTLKKYNVFIDEKKNKKLEELNLEDIYSNLIINVLIKSGKIEEKNEEEKEFTKSFIKQLDLANIELTENIYKEIAAFLEGPNNKYRISNHKDLNNEKKINFFNNLFIILKQNIYIYHIDFLNQIRKEVIQIIKEKDFSKNDGMEEKKLKYVIEFLTDSEYYYKNYEKYFNSAQEVYSESYNIPSLNISNNQESQNRLNSSNLYCSSKEAKSSNDQNQEIVPLIQSNNNHSENNHSYNSGNENESESESDNLSNSSEDKYKILKFEKYIMGNEYNNSKTKQLIALSSGHYIRIDYNENIFIYDENYNERKLIETPNSIILNIIENGIKDCDGKPIDLIVIAFDHINFYTLDLKNISKGLQQPSSSNSKIVKSNCHNYFSLLLKNNNLERDYLVSGQFGIERELDKQKKFLKLAEEYFINAIKVTDNIYAFSSNQIFENGDNIIKIYDSSGEVNIRENNIITIKKEQEYSFTDCKNGLCVIDINKKFKLLLCACKRYIPFQKNGILMIKIDVKNFKVFEKFEETEDFGVNCFCKIYESDDKKLVYILVGGFEFDKRRGIVKLYKITFDENEEKLEFIQDAIEEYELLENNDFDGMIENIIKSKHKKRDIIISCLDGSNYLFNLPKDDNYFKDL